VKTPFGKRNTRRCWISVQFPLETFTTLLGQHLETFRELERLQTAALEGVKSQGLEGLTAMLSRQGEILTAIAREKGELRPYLDQWEGLPADVRAKLRSGRPGEILESLESVAKTIQARHQEMFGADEAAGNPAGPAGSQSPQGQGTQGGEDGTASKEQDLSQRIHLYRGLQ